LANEPNVAMDTVSPSLEDLRAKFEALYESEKRLKHRAYLVNGSFTAPYRGKNVQIPETFLAQVKIQAELMLERGNADHLFYSDLGHGHLLLPEGEESQTMEAVLASPHLKILYHTAELLEMRKGSLGPLPTDSALAWRYYSRNVLAHGRELAVLFAHGAIYNTVREIPGYREVGTFYISGSRDGCFPYRQGERRLFFDLSLQR
jgi:hypothetical protein